MLVIPSRPQLPLMVPGPDEPSHIELRATPRNELYPPSDTCGNAMAVRCRMHVYNSEA
jgi:hypothetical protein